MLSQRTDLRYQGSRGSVSSIPPNLTLAGVVSPSVSAQARLYMDNLRDYKFVSPTGFGTINAAKYTFSDIDSARVQGREKRLYPVLEKLLESSELTEDDNSVLNIAVKFGGVDQLYHDSIIRFNLEKKYCIEAEKLGFKLPLLTQIEPGILERELIFSKDVSIHLLNSIDYSQTLVLPEQFKSNLEFNQEYYSIQKLILDLNQNSNAKSLLDLYSFAEKLKLKDIVENLDKNPIFLKDKTSRSFIKSLDQMRAYEVFKFVEVVGVNTPKLPEELIWAYDREIFNRLRLYNMYTAKAFGGNS